MFLFCFLLSDLMVFEKPSFHTPLIYCERSTYACRVTTVSLWKLLMRFPIAGYHIFIKVNCSVTMSLSQLHPSFAIRPDRLLAHVGQPVQCRYALTCKHASHIAAVQDFYYRLSRPLYIVAIGMITAITRVPTMSAIRTMISGSMAARTLWVVISTSSS